ncbi:MAG: putative manganese-dependent inorganic diphosphatase [Methanomicrobiales archaeon]|jgi:manganese-dependent inorganic pyrophosphatase|nr:putative manganese-dependent inorganic diphosphatase [Methanomicrobiales archaeon]
MQKTYVIGHQHPDTDSIASAIAYAHLLNQIQTGEFIAARCGEINPETAWALEQAGVEAPLLLDSVEPCVADIPFLYPYSASSNMPIIDVAALMNTHDVRNIPIIDENERLIGIVGEYGLARAYVTPHISEQLTVEPIPLETLARILDAKIIYAAQSKLCGNVSIVTAALDVSLSSMSADSVAVVGDNESVQLALISAGIAAIIVSDGAMIGEHVVEEAKRSSVSLLATPLSAFSVGRMVHLSHPAEQVMDTDIDIVHLSDLVSTAKKIVTNSKYRAACVVDENWKLLGMLSRNTFIENIQKSVILVDHNEFAQGPDGLEKADVREIIDHHRIGTQSTLYPIRFQNEPVGSTSTIITSMYQEAGVSPHKALATILLAGILSDTLVLKMSTTTCRDHKAVEYLATHAGIDYESFGMTLIKKGMELENIPLDDLLTRDTKRYTLAKLSITIAQIMTASDCYQKKHETEIKQKIEILRDLSADDLYIVMFTDVLLQVSYLYISGSLHLLTKLEYLEQPLVLKGVMSRKKDLLPMVGKALMNLEQ